jgi:hypothetical protein
MLDMIVRLRAHSSAREYQPVYNRLNIRYQRIVGSRLAVLTDACKHRQGVFRYMCSIGLPVNARIWRPVTRRIRTWMKTPDTNDCTQLRFHAGGIVGLRGYTFSIVARKYFICSTDSNQPSKPDRRVACRLSRAYQTRMRLSFYCSLGPEWSISHAALTCGAPPAQFFSGAQRQLPLQPLPKQLQLRTRVVSARTQQSYHFSNDEQNYF